MSARDPLPRARAHALLCLGAALACEVVVLGRMHLAEIVCLVPDDSFFYLIVAERLRDSGEFSFDGEHLSYGFQPLYQLLVAALACVVRDPVALLRGALVLGSVFHVASAGLLFLLVRRLFGSFGAWIALAFWLANPALAAWFWSVKENGLYALLLLWMFLDLERAMTSAEPRRHARRLGVLFGLLALTRVNFVALWAVVAALVALGWGWRRPLVERLRWLAVSAGWACLVAGPWFVFARLHFGTALPISGVVKLAASKNHVVGELGLGWLSPGHCAYAARAAADYLDWTLKGGASGYAPLLQGGVIAALAGWAWARFRRRVVPPVFGHPVLALAAAIAACALSNAFLNALLMPQYLAYGQRYTVPEYVALGVGVGGTAALARRTLASRAGLVLLAPSLALGVLLWTEVRRVDWEWGAPARDVLEKRPSTRLILLEVGLWVRDHVPDGERIGLQSPGIVTYFSRRKLIPLEPLVNSLAYFRAEGLDPVDYVRRNRISYVFGPGVRRDGRLHSLLLPEGCQEVVWVPYPDVDLRWLSGEPSTWMLVRPLDTPAAPFLRPEDFEFGAYAPDSGEADPRAAARAARTARALAGMRVEFDVLRVRLGARPGARARQWLDEDLARDGAPGPDGWIDWDVSEERGRSARVEVTGAGTLEDVHCVDLR